jgi:ABC-type branched-subunit amino acid transport system substrate-binding protein
VVEGLRRERRGLTVYARDAVARRLPGARVVGLASGGGEPSPALRRAFRAAFGRDPGPEAAAGHAAMRAVLAAIARAGAKASVRAEVIEAYRRTTPPALGLSLVTRSGGRVTERPLR